METLTYKIEEINTNDMNIIIGVFSGDIRVDQMTLPASMDEIEASDDWSQSDLKTFINSSC